MEVDINSAEDILPELAMPFDPPADRRNPYPDFAVLRRDRPVVLAERGDLKLAWLFRHADVAAALTDHTRYSNFAARIFLGPTLGENLLAGQDPPELGKSRRLVMPAFAPQAIGRWKDEIVVRTIGDLLDEMAAKPDPDIVRDVALTLPTLVMTQVLGLPRADYPDFRRWTMQFIAVAGDPETAFAAGAALRAYLEPIIRERMADPGEDLISVLAITKIDGVAMSYDDILSFLLTLLPAGIETTYRALGALMLTLLQDRSLWEDLVANPSKTRAAVEEMLRMEAPLQVVFRTAREDLQVAGVHIPSGSHVIPVIGSANRDETANHDPDRFLIDRPGRTHLTFGSGGHSCIGMHLAKAELTSALDALIRRFPDMQLAPRTNDDLHIRGLMVRSPASVPVRLT